MIGFAAAAGMALTILAAVVVLPAHHQRAQALADRHHLALQANFNNRLIEYNERLIEAVKTDPILTQKLLMEQQNYRRPDHRSVAIAESPPDPHVPALLAAQMAHAAEQAPRPRRNERFTEWALRVQDPATRRGLMLLAGLLMTAAMVLFGPRRRPA